MAAASTSNFNETYIKRDILVSYLQQHQDKSWINLDSSWLSHFLDEAKSLNQGNFTALNEKDLLFGHPTFVVSKGISVLEDEQLAFITK
ncbi:hypothetical protein RhiirA1_455965 [Rhizophagus irregularis]|uniref:Uncharacterized protein n=1 Tax=Rhizophagus irregularis TaxID=588596 RepID=A0A2N0S1R6_9GLOM|nr:hypothetical protein RhiirA1_455965 [Rhizophagus irregularis]